MSAAVLAAALRKPDRQRQVNQTSGRWRRQVKRRAASWHGYPPRTAAKTQRNHRQHGPAAIGSHAATRHLNHAPWFP
jgi:hypothetical protein